MSLTLTAIREIMTGPIITPYQKRRLAHLWKLFPRMVDVLPEGSSGDVEIRHFDADETHCRLQRLRKNELWTPGRYCQLNIGGVGWMYDILHERAMNERAVINARGHVLIGGLGIGMILWPILAKPEVASVTVLENSRDVHRLVARSLYRVPGLEKLEIEIADAREWTPPAGRLYDAIWLDCVPCYGYGSPVLKLHTDWMDRFRSFLLDPDHGYLDHWGYHENLQWMIDRQCSHKPRRSRFPYPIGPASGDVKVFLDNYESLKVGDFNADQLAAYSVSQEVHHA